MQSLAGKIAEFTGITAPYEAPENPALSLDTGSLSVEQSVAQILHKLAPRLYPAVVNPAPGG
jgi:adenylylsulfate kinase